ncbi:MAG TPA: ABC transporter permease [Gaiellales bacterium]|jgi:ABC-type nitrate/sulfonate/bicarbonate transport system permease component|nr:ABC transporter permease [Gaiellales bacterium]
MRRPRLGWVVVLAAVLGAWQAWVRLRGVPEYLLPAPTDIASALVDDRGRLAADARTTLGEMLAGFAAAVGFGLAAAAVLHFSTTLRRAVYPLLVASQSIPVVAIAPVLVIYLGFGLAPKVVIVALVCFFPVTVNALDGLRSVDPEYLRVMRTLRASRAAIFRRVEVPWALPAAFSGARVAASYAAVAALFAEYAGGSSGLGETMQTGTAQLDAPLVGAAVVVLAALALALFAAVSAAERLAIPWARRGG